MMAKRSDFAQKLLYDLRLRKEQMAVNQSSRGTSATAGDAHSYSKQRYKESRKQFTHTAAGAKMGNMPIRSTGGNPSLCIENTKQTVRAGSTRNSERVGDLSMALTFAFQNGLKLGEMDFSKSSSILGFLNQIGRVTVDAVKIERKGNFDKHRCLTHLHVKEISKRAKKLNQILRACSNGLNFDKYSIEIGKELLKGAIDLEETLRMLVNLQNDSDCMANPQKKNRIRLLEDDEDQDDNILDIVENMQLDIPRFSFDKLSRRSQSQQGSKTTKDRSFNNEHHISNTSNLVHHNRSVSLGSSTRNAMSLSETKAQRSSALVNHEKKGTSNVIAKLMGLQELPDDTEYKYIARKEPTPKQKIETKETHTLAIQTLRQKAILAKKNKIPPDNALFGVHGARSLPSRSSRFEKPPIVKSNKSDSGTLKIETKAVELRQMSKQPHKSIETANILRVNTRGQENILQAEKRSTNKPLIGNKHSDQGVDRKNEVIISQPKKEKHLHGRKQNGKEAAFTSISKPMHDTSSMPMKNPHTHLRKVDVVETRRFANPHILARPFKNKKSILQDIIDKRREKNGVAKRVEQVSGNESKEAEICIVKANISEVSLQALNVEQQLQNSVDEVSAFYSPGKDEHKVMEESQIQAPNDSNQRKTSNSSNQALLMVSFDKDEDLNSQEPVLSASNGTCETSLDIFYPSKVEQHNVPKSKTEEQLTDTEIHLSRILSLNHPFRSAAEALFKLNIPASIGHDYQGEENQLLLDCGYEIMKMIGRRQELPTHHFMKKSVSFIKVNSFNELVKQLDKDFEKVKSYDSGNGQEECDVADNLAMMIEKDVCIEDPDTNCMWDFGWNAAVSSISEKDDIVQDIERHVLNRLIDEITMDFSHLSFLQS